MRVVQPGTGEKRPVLLTFFCGVSIARFAKDLGPRPMIVEVAGKIEHVTREALEQACAKAGGHVEEVAIAGYSAGALYGVREAIATVRPEVVLAFDGTHGHLDVWKPLCDRARRREVLFVASHTYLVYTEKLGPPHAPYDSTVTTLRKATGWELPEPAGSPLVPKIHREGDLVIYSYNSGDADKSAHGRQITDVAPMLVRDWLGARWLGEAAPMPSGETVSGLVEAALDTLDSPSTPPKDSPPLVLDAIVPSHGYRVSVAECAADAKKLGKLRLPSSGYVPKVGDVVLSARLGEDPLKGGRGHYERIVEVSDGGQKLVTIGGNEQNAWIVAPYIIGPDFRAFIDVDERVGALAVVIAGEELRAGVKEIAGSKAHARIQLYHAGGRRLGSPLAGLPGHEKEGSGVLGAQASDEVPWCASAGSWCQAEALKRLSWSG